MYIHIYMVNSENKEEKEKAYKKSKTHMTY